MEFETKFGYVKGDPEEMFAFLQIAHKNIKKPGRHKKVGRPKKR